MPLKEEVKNITKDLFYNLGIFRFLLRLSSSLNHPKLLLITYHKISSSLDDEYLAVPHESFEQHVKFIKDNFKTVSMAEGLKALYENDSREIYAAINFDDGYMDNYLYGYPILKKYGVPATIFIATDFIGKSQIFWWDRVFNIVSSYFKQDDVQSRGLKADNINKALINKDQKEIEHLIDELEKKARSIKEARPSLMMGWREIKEMNNALITFGAHTKTHRNLCLLKDDEVRKELTGSKREIEKALGIEVSEFAYPFGAFDERIKNLVREAGFKCARTTSVGFNYKNADRFSLSYIGGGYLLKTSSFAARITSNSFKRPKEIAT